jgi:acyl-CoA thioesterase I
MQSQSVAPARTGRKLQIAVAVAVAVLLAWIFWPSASSRVTNLDSRGTALVAFGDSLTAGYGASPGEDYPTRLGTAMSQPVVNAGRSGDTSESALGRLESDVLATNPRLVIVGLGGNDFLRGEPITRTEANLRAIVKRIQGAGAMVVLLGFEFPSLGANYGNMYARVAKEEGCLLVEDVMDGILNDRSLKSDEIHPNAKGYALMAERIEGPVKDLLAKAE